MNDEIIVTIAKTRENNVKTDNQIDKFYPDSQSFVDRSESENM